MRNNMQTYAQTIVVRREAFTEVLAQWAKELYPNEITKIRLLEIKPHRRTFYAVAIDSVQLSPWGSRKMLYYWLKGGLFKKDRIIQANNPTESTDLDEY